MCLGTLCTCAVNRYGCIDSMNTAGACVPDMTMHLLICEDSHKPVLLPVDDQTPRKKAR